MNDRGRTHAGRVVAVLAACVLLVAGLAPVVAAAPSRPIVPVLAYYYIWFDTGSWERAKTDRPQLGAYSSDDAAVMREHIRAAKNAGINGFIVSWKHSEKLTNRLRRLIDIARSEEFKLALNYEGLDNTRAPLPIEKVEADLALFAGTFAPDPVFRVVDRPIVIWTGSRKASRADIARVASTLHDRVALLASMTSAADYRPIADLVSGNAYYWSSVDTGRDRGHAARLGELATAVHDTGGLWVAPVAPGFDARSVGGSRVVERRDGAELREQYRVAMGTSPDALGIISWNEFLENTHVEPSVAFGDRYLRVLRDLTGVALPDDEVALDSSSGDGRSALGWWVLAGTGLALACAVLILWRRTGRGRRSPIALGALGLVLVACAAALTVPAEPGPEQRRPADPVNPTRFHGAKPVRAPDAVVVTAAGDIACAADAAGRGVEADRRPVSCQEHRTADLMTAIGPDAVLPLGDLQYPNGSLRRFREAYDRTWGRFKDRSYPVVGNHEYSVAGAEGYFDYFGPVAGSVDAGYYSYDLGTWHVVALNSECERVGGCELGSPQEQWLRADLAAHPAACTLLYWHRPRFSSGKHGSAVRYAALWQAGYDAGADLVLTAHDHDYERFAPLTAGGEADPARGPRSIVVGTGGSTLYQFHDVAAGSEVRLEVFGVLELTLRPGSYDWRFVTVPDAAVADAGSDACH